MRFIYCNLILGHAIILVEPYQDSDKIVFKSEIISFKKIKGGFPGGAVVKNLPANAGDTGSSPRLGRSHMPRSN